MEFAKLYNESEFGKKYPDSKFYNARATAYLFLTYF